MPNRLASCATFLNPSTLYVTGAQAMDLKKLIFGILGQIRGVSTPLGGLSWERDVYRIERPREFREGVIDDLGLFYPKPGNWSMGFDRELRNSISRIETRVHKFKFYVPDNEQDDLISAWCSFKLHALDLKWESIAASRMYPSESCAEGKDLVKAFYNKLDRLLEFAQET